MRVAPPIKLSEQQREELESNSRGRSIPARVVERSRIVLLAAAGKQDREIAAALSVTRKKASRWRKRFLRHGLAGLNKDAPRPGRRPTISPERVSDIATGNHRPAGRSHLIADNYATHKHEKVQRWLKRHPKFHVHFTPTSASWLNMAERFFRDLTDKRVRRGAFRSVPELEQAILSYIEQHNRKPKPFIWTARACDILEKVKRGRAALNKTHSE